jgi:hypothetical protein
LILLLFWKRIVFLLSFLQIFRKIDLSLAWVICTTVVTWSSIFHGQELTASVNRTIQVNVSYGARLGYGWYASLRVTSLSLLYRIVNVVYIWTLFSMLNPFCHEWSRLVTLCHELLYFLGFDLCTVSMTLVDAT